MPKIYPEALAYCILWAALAVAGFMLAGWQAGALLSVGLFLIVMPASALVLTRTGNFVAERAVRWGILVVAAILLASFLDLR
ncbi:MAG: hypothetical protein JWP15_1432 [Alphaproteobacteria bacterium]|nr:hypothetical protein [Alphaproteobacteria bacterium]